MSAELLDIVDERNELTGEIQPRSIVHATGLWHRVVSIYYFYNKGDQYYFLVHLRAASKEVCPNCWDTHFGGHVKAGQTIQEAACEELEEETGVKIESDMLLQGPIVQTDHPDNKEFNYIFFCKGKEDISGIHFQDDEVEEVKWMSVEEIMQSYSENPASWSQGITNFSSVLGELQKFEI